MRVRSVLAALGCAAALAVAGAGTAAADGGATPTAKATLGADRGPEGTAKPVPTTGATDGTAKPVPTTRPTDRTAKPVPTTRPTDGSGRTLPKTGVGSLTGESGGQVTAMPKGAPDTGVPTAEGGSGQSAAAVTGEAAAGVLVAGAGAFVLRRRMRARG